LSQDPIRCRQERLVWENGFVRVYDDDVSDKDGAQGRHVRVVPVHAGAGVVLLPLQGAQVALVKTYRYPLAAWQWALPRGFAQSADPLETARNELREELGVERARLSVLGHVTPDSGLLANTVAIVLAEVEDAQLEPQDRQEVHAVRWVNLEALEQEVSEGRIEDAFTLAALFLAGARRVLRKA